MKFIKAETLKAKPDPKTLVFGRTFTDYMFKMDYNPENGWHNSRIEPFAPLTMSPASTVFHYAQEIFEGMKAFLNADGEICLFRPEENFKRMNESCDRLCIPRFDIELAMEGLKELVKVEKDWIPTEEGTSLYIRPTIIATDAFLGVSTSKTYLFFIILSPVGSYYAGGLKPVKIYVEDFYVRAAVGGTGAIKCGGNYAASLIAGEKAHKEGFSQVLWLDAREKKYIEEVGAMNMFFVIDNVVVTPSLTGSILPGITRKSVLEIARSLGYETCERQISIDEICECAANGRLTEAFGSGTAAVISPVGLFRYKDVDYPVNGEKMGEISLKIYDKLTGIQRGTVQDEFGYIVKVK